MPSLAPGTASAATVSVTIPASTPAGTYFLLACAADDNGTLPESGETNSRHAHDQAARAFHPEAMVGMPDMLAMVGPTAPCGRSAA